ncbi:transcriptional regulator [Limosilactobacillus ingluviei]|uniref:transcriptional regulator n=1 Tax=Limosilactobacillus ingluviei TaxID=148604 RepID=UPI0024BB4D88|nr:transcriptional regulator [Limosilactobacillus ingluviei]
MRRETKALLKDILRDYPQLEKRIKQRREEIMHPTFDRDDNIGGGRSNVPSNYLERRIIKMNDDEELQTLIKEKQLIDLCLDESDEETQTIIKEVYMGRTPQYSLSGLIAAGKIYCSQTRAYKLRDDFFNDLAGKMRIKYM